MLVDASGAGDGSRGAVRRKIDDVTGSSAVAGSSRALGATSAGAGMAHTDRKLLAVTAKLASKNARDVADIKAAVFHTSILQVESKPLKLAIAERTAYNKRIDVKKEAGEQNLEGGA